MDVRLPDGTIVQNVPDGITQAELMARMGRASSPAAPAAPAAPAYKPSWIEQKLGIPPPSAAVQEGIRLAKERPWGSGVEKAAYNAGSAVTDAAAKVGLPPEVAGGAGFLANVGAQAVPALFGGNVAGAAAAPLMEWTGKRLMQSALKPPKPAMLSGDGGKAIQTLLDEGVNVSAGGAAKLQGKIDALKTQVADAIMSSTATVDRGRVASRAQDTIKRFENQVNPNADVAAIENAMTEFLSAGPKTMSVQQAQSMKQGTYERLSKKYGEMKGADIEAQKALTRGLKEEIADVVPGVGAMNEKMAPLINAGKMVLGREATAGNKDPIVFALLANSLPAGLALQASRSELVKSMLARAAYSGKEKIPATTAAVIEAMSNRSGVYE